ncbi:MAG: DNA adenine methylase [Myxococcales bacterium]|nr:DNA adenine methylase [Myxococcales bacterium]
MIKYIGSKRLLVEQISTIIGRLADVRTVLDLFSGTARVGHALKQRGYHVTANDHTTYAHRLAQCYVQADRAHWHAQASALIAELGQVPAQAGYFTQTFCVDSRYFQPQNGARVDAIRERIAELALPEELEAVALVSLMEAADRVDSTVGLQMAYLKKWAPRAFNELELRVPELVGGPGQALQLDALECFRAGSYDVVYLDPPYNQHKYMNNYHVWESLMRWDKPATYGVANKRVDCREYDSPFNSKPRIAPAFAELIEAVRARYLLVSFNNEGYLAEEQLREMLSARGQVQVLSVAFKRYVGAQIGIYNPNGEKTGKVSHLDNKELLYLVDCEGAGMPELGG